MRTLEDLLCDFASAEVRRALVEELERLLPHIKPGTWVYVNGHYQSSLYAMIDARLRELRGETEQGPGVATVADSALAVLADVREERRKQDVQWGGPTHDDTHDPAEFAGFIRRQLDAMRAHDARERFVKVAALAVAAVESWDRTRPGSSPRASDTAQTAAKAAGSIPPPGATLRERAERLLVCIPEPTFRKWAVDNAVALANDEADRAAQEMEAKMDEELHAVRMEAQTLREANEAWSFANGKLIGWIKLRQAWTGGNDPRDLSGTRWDICALRGDAPPRGFEARPGSSPTTETPVVKAGQTMHVGTDRSLLVHFAQTAAKDAGSTPAPGTYYAVRDENGYATAICRDGFAIVNLHAGAWINEQNGGVDAILAALNKPEPKRPASDTDSFDEAVLADIDKGLERLERPGDAVRADLERRTKELLRSVALDCEEMPPRPAGCDCLACRARALLAEWEQRHAD